MIARVFRTILTGFTIGRRQLHTTANLSCIYVRDPRCGYKKIYDRPLAEQKLSTLGKMRQGWRIFKEEFGLWIEEMKEIFRMDPIFEYRRNEVDVVWRFKGDQKSLDQWVVSCDSDYNEGYSTAKLEMSSTGTGVFSGVLSNRLPKDGKLSYAGYCNISTIPKYKSFYRETTYDWTEYTHLVLRIRGDGRCYGLNLSTSYIFDLTWNDMYQYIVHTRGGPYWQYVKVPFSKFVFVSKGRVQDNQAPITLNEVKNFGITLADDVSGHFRLEIDYIGVEHDIFEYEESAYETYNFKGVRF